MSTINNNNENERVTATTTTTNQHKFEQNKNEKCNGFAEFLNRTNNTQCDVNAPLRLLCNQSNVSSIGLNFMSWKSKPFHIKIGYNGSLTIPYKSPNWLAVTWTSLFCLMSLWLSSLSDVIIVDSLATKLSKWCSTVAAASENSIHFSSKKKTKYNKPNSLRFQIWYANRSHFRNSNRVLFPLRVCTIANEWDDSMNGSFVFFFFFFIRHLIYGYVLIIILIAQCYSVKYIYTEINAQCEWMCVWVRVWVRVCECEYGCECENP